VTLAIPPVAEVVPLAVAADVSAAADVETVPASPFDGAVAPSCDEHATRKGIRVAVL
jgi:hypothetical protein